MFKYLLLCFVGFVYGAEVIDYCRKDLQCDKDKHTLCDQPCKGDGIPVPHDLKWRERSLYWHNYFRDRLASGSEFMGANSAASNMRALSWDMGLEFTAACWLYIRNDKIHDKCRGTPKFPRAGQNLWTSNKVDPTHDEGIRSYIFSWFSELNDSWHDVINEFVLDPKFYPSGRKRIIEHFTQVCWATTTHVGCARSLRPPEESKLFLVACNYGPPGNLEKKPRIPVYKRGEGASDCPEGMEANKDFPHLCGEIDPMPPEASIVGLPELDARQKTGEEEKNRRRFEEEQKEAERNKTLKKSSNASIVKEYFIKYLVFVAIFAAFH